MSSAESLLSPDETFSGRDPELAGRRWPWVVFVVIVAMGVALWFLDGRVRQNEINQLTVQVTAGQQSITQAEANIASMVDYGAPLLFSSAVSAGVRTDLQALVERAAGEGAGGVRSARGQLSEMAVLPWHGSIERARIAYQRYLDARIASLDATSLALAAAYRSHPEFADLLRQAREASVAAAASDPVAATAFERLLAGTTTG
jgi:hypothetical protein